MEQHRDKIICAIDQGTSSSRVIAFHCFDWSVICKHQVEFASIYPEEGWCEQDPLLLLNTVKQCLKEVAKGIVKHGFKLDQVVGMGITNQRETTVAWDRETGKALHNAIVWFDARTKTIVDQIIQKSEGGQNVIKERCGLPISTYFSAGKMKWLMDNVAEVKAASDNGNLMFGTVDSWLLWHLTGKKSHVTDVTNASRTMLMDIKSLRWDPNLCALFDLKMSSLPTIKSSAETYGFLQFEGCPFKKVPISGCLGDQQAALVGQKCFKAGMAKSTYGTGCFMLYNVGPEVIFSNEGLLSTVAYQFGNNSPPTYALEGSIATTGSAITWLKNIGLIKTPAETEELASKVEDTGGVYFVPAFNGLFAPHWRSDARGTICGLTQYTRKEHICRATLEAVAFQVLEILKGMQKDSGYQLKALLVDGGMTKNDLLMRIQADFLGINVIRPEMVETTSLGAALAAAWTLGLWSMDQKDLPVHSDDHHHHHKEATVFHPHMQMDVRDAKFGRWDEAVQRSLGWEKQHL